MTSEWVESIGALAVFLGGILEGEAVFIAAGYAISQGYIDPLPTLVLAALGGTVGDHLYYAIGRRYGRDLIRRVRWLRHLRAHAVVLLGRWGRSAAFLIRFAYGLRIVLPMSMGVARYPIRLFLPFNALGAVAFASIYLTIGYFFGEIAEEVFGWMRAREMSVLLGILVLGAMTWVIREWRLVSRPPKRPAPDD